MEENKEDVKEEVSTPVEGEESQSDSSTDEGDDEVSKLKEENQQLKDNLRKQSKKRSSLIKEDDGDEDDEEEADDSKFTALQEEVQELKQLVKTSDRVYEKPALARFYETEQGRKYAPENDSDGSSWKKLSKHFRLVKETVGVPQSEAEFLTALRKADSLIDTSFSEDSSKIKESAGGPGTSTERKDEGTSKALNREEENFLKFAGGDELVDQVKKT